MRAEPNGAELDLDAFKKRLQAAREFELQHGGMRLRCVLPLPIEERIVASRYTEAGTAGVERWLHELAVAAVIGWSHVYVRDVDAHDKHGNVELPCTPDTARLLLSARLDLNDALGQEILRRRRERDTRLEADQKNSASASPGSDPGKKRSVSPAYSETPSPLPS